jgi:VanZ family protein
MVATICLIWGNSLLNGETSGNISGGFSQWLGQFIPFLSPDSPNGHYLLRKCAHFSIFFLLGAEACCFFHMICKNKPLLCSISLATAVASIDESIQRFIPDRHGCLSDVLLDISGAATGMILLYLGYTLLKRKK